MSYYGSLQKEEDLIKLGQEIHEKTQEKSLLESVGGFLIISPYVQLLISVASILSALAFINYVLSGDPSLLQIYTPASLVLLYFFIELPKTASLSKTLDLYFVEQSGEGAKNYFLIKFFGFFAVLFTTFSFYTSLKGVEYYTENQTNEVQNLSSLVVPSVVSLDSITNVYQQKISAKKAFFDNENVKIENKITQVKSETKDLWSPQAKANAKVIPLLESQIVQNNDKFNDFEEKTNEQMNEAIKLATAKNDSRRQSVISQKTTELDRRGDSTWVFTLICEFATIALQFARAYLESKTGDQQRQVNQNLRKVKRPIIIEEENILEVEFVKMKTELQKVKQLQIQGGLFQMDQPKSTIGFQNSTNQLHGTGCRNESEFINRFNGLISDLKENKADFRTLMENHKANTVQVEYAKAYIQRNMQ